MAIRISGTTVIDDSRNITSIGNMTGTAGITITATGATLGLAATGANVITASTNGTERLRITSVGNIHTPAGSTTMTNGFLYIPAAAGAPTGAATAITGTVPLYYDSTNNRLFAYNTSWQNLSSSLSLVSSNANGVVYLNGSSQATTSTSFTYDGSAVTIAGNLTFSGTGRRITGDFSNATLANRTFFQTSTTNSESSVFTVPNGTSTISSFAAFNSSDTANSGYGILYVNQNQVILSSDKTGTGTYLPLLFGAGGTERMRVDTAGNVGIGTTSPNYSGYGTTNLTIKGGTTIQGVLELVGTRADGNGLTAGDVNFFADSNTSGKRIVAIQAITDGVIANNRGGALLFSVKADAGSLIERMRLNQNGQLGIGVSSPSQALDVNGTIKCTSGLLFYGDHLLNGDTSSTVLLRVGPSPSYAYLYINNQSSNPLIYSPNGILAFGTGISSIEKMRIDSSGNVSIGTTSVISKVTVNGELAFTSTNKAIYHYYYSGTNYAYVSTTGGGDITWTTGTYAPTERMRLSADSGQLTLYTGNLYITRSNSADTVASIIQNSSSTASSNSAVLFWNNTAGGSPWYQGIIQFFCSNSNNEFRLNNTAPNSMTFYTNNSKRVEIGGDGAFFNPFAYSYNADGTYRTACIRSDGLLCSQSSTRRLKINIEPLDDVSFIMNLKPVKFKWKKKINGAYVNTPRDNKIDYGFIAEEVAEVDERLATYEKVRNINGDVIVQPDGLAHLQFLAPAIRFIQQLKIEFDIFKVASNNEIEALRAELNALKGIN